MIEIFAVVLLSTVPSADSAQKVPQQKESVTVSAGISKEQLAAEQRLNDILVAGDQAQRGGDLPGAIRQYEKARDMANSDKLLEEQRDRVLDRLGRAYASAGRADDAISSYSALVELRKDDCKPGSDYLSTCADGKRSLGYSKMLAADFEGALPILRDAEAAFGMAEKVHNDEGYSMIQLMKQAETQLLVSVALFRTGKKQEAVTVTDSAIRQLSQVETDKNIQQSIRDSATKSRKRAEEQLELLKAN
jgi:tetratricopeptide (TPR) repeat protein